MDRNDKPGGSAPASTASKPRGHRPRGPEHFASEAAAAAFRGLAGNESHHEIGQLLQKAGTELGWHPRLIHHFRLLLDWTRPQDWVPGARPIVWLSVGETADLLDITPSQVRRNEKKLHELGAISWKDYANHRRFGERDGNHDIVEAWGLDLSPVAALLPELRDIAGMNAAERSECRCLRQKIASLRTAILAALDSAGDARALHRPALDAWRRLAVEAAEGWKRSSLGDLRERLRRLEAIDIELRSELGHGDPDDDPCDDPHDGADTEDGGGRPGGDSPESYPQGVADDSVSGTEMQTRDASDAPPGAHPCAPPYNTTKGTVCENSTVARSARREGKAGSETRPDPFPWMDGEAPVAGVPISAFLAMMPEAMRGRVPHRGPVWRPIVDAAGDIAADIGISRHAWGDACLDLGPEAAAIALAIVAVKHQRGIVHSPGGYFRQMTRRHATGELHLAPSVFGLLPEDWRAAGDAGAERGRAH